MNEFKNENKTEPIGQGSEGDQKIKLGDAEYTTTELQDLVTKGRFAKEVEEKQNTKLDKLMPEFTKATQELKSEREARTQLEKQIAEFKSQMEERNSDITPEQKAAAIKQAEELGILTKQNANSLLQDLVDQRVQNILAGRDLLNKIDSSINWAKNEYGIEVAQEDLLEYMRDNGFRDPKKAIKDQFEDQIDKAKQQKWFDSKGPEFRTLSQRSTRKEPISPDFKDKDKVRKMAIEQLISGS